VAAALLNRVPLDQITREARHARPGRSILAVIAGFLFGLGWLLARTLGLAWFAVAWCGTAVKVGWQEGRAGARRSRAG
jgi:uncharacterized membrane protein YedE/YeeE